MRLLVKTFFLILIIGLAAGVPNRAHAFLSEELLAGLPSPISYLTHADRAGEGLQKALLEGLNHECSRLPADPTFRLKRGCQIPGLVRQYSQLLEKLSQGENGVALSLAPAVKPWDLSAILSGQFIIKPDPYELNAGRELLVDLFLTRDQITQAIHLVYIPASQRVGRRLSPERRLAGLFLQAYVLTSSPLGALNVVYSGLQCPQNDRSCEVLKSLWGAVCSIAVENHSAEFDELEKRLGFAFKEESPLSLGRLKYIQSLHDYVQKGNLGRAALLQKLEELEGEGQSGYADMDYADLALSVLIYNELKHLMSLKANCQPYTEDLSKKTKSLYKKQLYALTKRNIENIENALAKYGVMNESGGL